MTPRQTPQSLLIAALGGEGGGVLADWIVAAALRAGLPVQATSVPGVAQRTGSTSYYLEFGPEAVPPGRQPVFALLPVPGHVDTVLASELSEAGRMAERGFVSAHRTWLITASHRMLTTQEKMAPGDGRFDDARLVQGLQASAARCIVADLQSVARRHGTVISAALYGALAGSGRLPWGRDIDEAVIRDSGVGVQASLAGYAEAFELAKSLAALPAPAESTTAPNEATASGELDTVVQRALARLRDYQDEAYAERYRQRVDRLRQAASRTTTATSAPLQGEPLAALTEAARQLALWMAYEDVIRVADLKTQPERLERVRAEAGAGPRDIVRIHEHLKPGLEEIAAIAPRRIGLWLRGRVRHDHPIGARGRGMTLETTSVHGYALLRLLAGLRRWRSHSLRFSEEQTAIDAWLIAMEQALPAHAGFARVLARLPQLRRGYSDTQIRGQAQYAALFSEAASLAAQPDDAAAEKLLAGLRAAQATPDAATPVRPGAGHAREQAVQWHPRVSTKDTPVRPDR